MALLEEEDLSRSMRERLQRAAVRLRDPGQTCLSAAFSLRTDQARVLERFTEYLASRSSAPAVGQPAGFCRVVLPPRTGKTVLAREIIGRSGLTATIVVPTRTLIQQTRRLLGEMLPRTPVGVLSGEERNVVTTASTSPPTRCPSAWGRRQSPSLAAIGAGVCRRGSSGDDRPAHGLAPRHLRAEGA